MIFFYINIAPFLGSSSNDYSPRKISDNLNQDYL